MNEAAVIGNNALVLDTKDEENKLEKQVSMIEQRVAEIVVESDEGYAYAGELTKGQKKTVTPAKAQFSVLPDDGYDFLSEVVVNGVPIAYADNPAGGQTVTIGA